MATALHFFCLVVGGIIFPLKVTKAVRNRDIANIAFSFYIGLSMVSYAILLPPVYARIDRAVGIPNTAGMISGASVLGLTAAQQALLMHWAFPARRARAKIARRVCFFGLLMVVFVAAFFTWPPETQKFEDFYVYYTRHPLKAPYLSVYLLGCVVGQLDVVRHCVKYSRVTNQPWIRTGMRTTAAGATLILVYCAIRAADVTGGQFGVNLRSLEPVAWLFGDLGSALAMTGWVLPNVGSQLSVLARRYRGVRAHNRLYPLWAALRDEVPVVALTPPVSPIRDRVRLRNIDFWLHRRVIEIEDAQRALRTEIDTALARLADGDAPPAEPPPAEPGLAERIARARLIATRHGGTEPAGDHGADHDPAVEIAWLCAVARAFVRVTAESRSVRGRRSAPRAAR